MSTTPEQPVEATLARAFDAIRSTPDRAPVAIAAGRNAFLAEARATRKHVALAARIERLRRWRITVSVCLAVLTGSAGVVYAAQYSLPDSPMLYHVKLMSEDLRYALARTADGQHNLLAEYASRRRDELRAMPVTSQAATRAQERLVALEAELKRIDRIKSLDLPVEPTATATRAATQTVLPTIVMAHATATAPATVTPEATSTAIATSTPQPTQTALPPQPSAMPEPVAVTVVPVLLRTPSPTQIALRKTATAAAILPAPRMTAVVATRAALATRVNKALPPPSPTAAPPLVQPPTRVIAPQPAPATATAPNLRATVITLRATLTALPTPVVRETHAVLATATAIPEQTEIPTPPPQPSSTIELPPTPAQSTRIPAPPPEVTLEPGPPPTQPAPAPESTRPRAPIRRP